MFQGTSACRNAGDRVLNPAAGLQAADHGLAHLAGRLPCQLVAGELPITQVLQPMGLSAGMFLERAEAGTLPQRQPHHALQGQAHFTAKFLGRFRLAAAHAPGQLLQGIGFKLQGQNSFGEVAISTIGI
jgi:hypothetical protein